MNELKIAVDATAVVDEGEKNVILELGLEADWDDVSSECLIWGDEDIIYIYNGRIDVRDFPARFIGKFYDGKFDEDNLEDIYGRDDDGGVEFDGTTTGDVSGRFYGIIMLNPETICDYDERLFFLSSAEGLMSHIDDLGFSERATRELLELLDSPTVYGLIWAARDDKLSKLTISSFGEVVRTMLEYGYDLLNDEVVDIEPDDDEPIETVNISDLLDVSMEAKCRQFDD